jgi:hypothetical protein
MTVSLVPLAWVANAKNSAAQRLMPLMTSLAKPYVKQLAV